MPLSLSDAQLKTVMTFAAAAIPPEKRPMFQERVGAMLAFRGRGRQPAQFTEGGE